MRLGGRLQAAIEILGDMEARRRPAADALKDWGLSHRFAGSGDRAAIGTIVYDALRLRRSTSWRFEEEGARANAFGGLLAAAGETADGIDAALAGDGHAPPPLTAAERAAWMSRRLDDAPLAVQGDVPDWCVPHFEAAFGPTWVAEAQALAARPPLDLRVNTLKATSDRVGRELVGAVPGAIAPDALRIAAIAGLGRHPNVQAEPSFAKGWFEVQDEGSQLVARLAAPEEPGQVLDYCAGAGGKTLALAALMANHGQIFAFDADKARLAPIFDRLKRASARNVQVLARRDALASLSGRMDLVLVDAPCTGTGTWRRRPDAKWRLTDRQVEARLAEQAAILADAATFVRPGGRLAYITCSLLPPENDGQIAAFLAAHDGYAVEDAAALWRRRLPGHDGRVRFPAGGGTLLSPALTGTDGFYCAVLRRAR